jgi:hypothetical protein
MDITRACEIMQEVAQRRGEAVLETAMYMQENLGSFEPREISAYMRFMQVGRDFFADVEESV